MIPKIALLVFYFTISLLPAQDYPWNLLLLSGDSISNVSLQKLSGDSLLIGAEACEVWISVTSIIEMRILKKSRRAAGLGLGFLAGATIGAAIGYASYEEPGKKSSGGWGGDIDFGSYPYVFGGGLIGAFAGMVTGGVIGAAVGEDEVYDLSKYSYEEKVKLIESKLSN